MRENFAKIFLLRKKHILTLAFPRKQFVCYMSKQIPSTIQKTKCFSVPSAQCQKNNVGKVGVSIILDVTKAELP